MATTSSREKKTSNLMEGCRGQMNTIIPEREQHKRVVYWD